METTDRRSAADKALEALLDRVVDLVSESKLRPDWRSQWFSNNQLDTLRRLYEQQGYQTARLYQVGQVERREQRSKQQDWESVRSQTLLQILDAVEESVVKNHLDQRVGAYLLGRLNAVLAEAEERRKNAL